MTRSEVRSTLVVVALVLVAVVALWPRGAGSSAPDPASRAPASSADSSAFVPGATSPGSPGPAPDPATLVGARDAAALAPCPERGAAPVGSPVRAFDGLTLECLGAPGRVDLARALAGRTTLVNLWASWCGPCRDEIPSLAAYAAAPDAVAVLGVAVADPPVSALALLSALGAHYPSVTDPDGVVAGRAGVAPVLPASVVVRPDGSVVPVPPMVFRSTDAVRAAVAAALAAPTPAAGRAG